MLRSRTILAALLGSVAVLAPAHAQTTAAPFYRVFLADGTALASFGEWARLEDRLIFSMPLTPDSQASSLHLVSIPAERVDWSRTEQYAEAVRAVQYAATRGEGDFARLSTDVARALNAIALAPDATDRLATAERTRQSLASWPAAHYGYRANEVQEILGVLDEVISSLRVSAGLGRYDIALTATTPPPPREALLPPPDHVALVQQLMTAATLVDTPAEKVSLLQSVVGLLDRAVAWLPAAWAAGIRAKALNTIADEQRVDRAYSRLRTKALATAIRYVEQADVRGVERLRNQTRERDEKLGGRRPAAVRALVATLDAHLDAAYRLRLARDRWLLRLDGLQAYQRATAGSVTVLRNAKKSLDQIRTLAGPPPQGLRQLESRLSSEARRLSSVQPPEELSALHAVFRSACELAENAVRLRLDAVAGADLPLAQQASSAAAGALLLLSRASSDLHSALRPPAAPSQPLAQP